VKNILCVLLVASALFFCTEARAVEIEFGPGWFFPYGDWSRDFSSGRLVEVRVYFPFAPDLELGGGFRAVSMPASSDHGSIEFLMPDMALRYQLSDLLKLDRFSPHVGFRAGLSREELKVGSGREKDIDVFVGISAGISWKVNSRVRLSAELSQVWFVAPGGAKRDYDYPHVLFPPVIRVC